MVVWVDGKDYVVKRPHGSKANVQLKDGSTHTCNRQYRPGTHRFETDLEMQTRVQELVTKLNAGQERAQPPFARLTLGSPALSASASIILPTEVECADAGNRRQTRDRPEAPGPKPARTKRSPRWAGSSDPMPDAAPKVARAAQGYTHDPAGFPSLPPAGPRVGWQMPSKRADLCGAAVDAAVATVQQPGIAPRAEPELVHRAKP